MIKAVELKNFKCFDQLHLPLSGLTILAGGNAVGKSTVLQALLLADATAREKGDSVDASEALGIAVGGPKGLISQNRSEIFDGDFSFNVQWDETAVTFVYKIDKLVSLKLSYHQSKETPFGQLFTDKKENLAVRRDEIGDLMDIIAYCQQEAVREPLRYREDLWNSYVQEDVTFAEWLYGSGDGSDEDRRRFLEAMSILSVRLQRECAPDPKHAEDLIFSFTYSEQTEGETIARTRDIECSPAFETDSFRLGPKDIFLLV